MNELEKRIEAIEKRNKRVETDKAWSQISPWLKKFLQKVWVSQI